MKTGRAAAGDALSDGCPSGQTTESQPLERLRLRVSQRGCEQQDQEDPPHPLE